MTEAQLELPLLGKIFVGPVLKNARGYAFETWDEMNGLVPSYTYPKIESAAYARSRAALAPGAEALDTVEAFRARYAKGNEG